MVRKVLSELNVKDNDWTPSDGDRYLNEITLCDYFQIIQCVGSILNKQDFSDDDLEPY